MQKRKLEGYVLNGTTRLSSKQGIRLRQIRTGDKMYRIRPSFVLPYMQARTDEVSKPMLLMRYSVPFWVIALLFGGNLMFWWRLFIALSTNNLVGTTVKDREKMPADVLADEYHTHTHKGEAYIATTVGGGCFLGKRLHKKLILNALQKHTVSSRQNFTGFLKILCSVRSTPTVGRPPKKPGATCGKR